MLIELIVERIYSITLYSRLTMMEVMHLWFITTREQVTIHRILKPAVCLVCWSLLDFWISPNIKELLLCPVEFGVFPPSIYIQDF